MQLSYNLVLVLAYKGVLLKQRPVLCVLYERNILVTEDFVCVVVA